MDGYDETTYGERFVDVYDDWYGDITDTDACVTAVAELAGGGPILELGVGTGRLAIPLAQRGSRVTGIDSSPAMLDALAAKPGGREVRTILGDMTEPATGDERFAVVLIAYNTLFNLTGEGAQARCFASAAARMAVSGCFVVEAFVPTVGQEPVEAVVPKQVTTDKVVLSVSRADPARQEITGQYVEFTEAGGVRLRPWHLRWSTVEQLDAMASAVGLRLTRRWSDWSGSAFTDESGSHISVYRHA
ncbi:MAG: class I SAM-dependent methyltransferase [Acidimicrobiales bacterium]|nr:class I SAM-dependent methyltransferase [Acidimicrobiales bacterium]